MSDDATIRDPPSADEAMISMSWPCAAPEITEAAPVTPKSMAPDTTAFLMSVDVSNWTTSKVSPWVSTLS